MGGSFVILIIPRSWSKVESQVTSQVVRAIERYSAIAEDFVTTCFLAFKEMGDEPRKMQYPLVDRLVTPQLF